MKSAFISFTISFGGNFTSCENKNGFVSKQGLRRSQVVRTEENLRNHPGLRGGPGTEGKQGYKHCELFLQDSSIEHLGLLPGTRIYYLVEVVPQGRTYSILDFQSVSFCFRKHCIDWLFPIPRIICSQFCCFLILSYFALSVWFGVVGPEECHLRSKGRGSRRSKKRSRRKCERERGGGRWTERQQKGKKRKQAHSRLLCFL